MSRHFTYHRHYEYHRVNHQPYRCNFKHDHTRIIMKINNIAMALVMTRVRQTIHLQMSTSHPLASDPLDGITTNILGPVSHK